MPKLLQHHFHYQNKHYVYVADAIRAIIKIIESTIFHNNNIENIEEHIRYDDNGLDVTKVLSLFERSNNVKFLKTDITYDNKKAPLSGKPS